MTDERAGCGGRATCARRKSSSLQSALMVRDPYTTLVQLSTGHIVTSRSLSLNELLDGARSGYAPYIGELRARYGDELEAAIESIVGDSAAEVVDDAFMALPRTLSGYSDEGRFHAWMFGVAFNRARTRARSDRRRPDRSEMPAGLEPSTLPDAEQQFDEALLMERALAVLTPAERDVWLLSYQGHEPRDIAQHLDIEVSAATVRLHRARKRLCEHLRALLRD